MNLKHIYDLENKPHLAVNIFRVLLRKKSVCFLKKVPSHTNLRTVGYKLIVYIKIVHNEGTVFMQPAVE